MNTLTDSLKNKLTQNNHVHSKLWVSQVEFRRIIVCITALLIFSVWLLVPLIDLVNVSDYFHEYFIASERGDIYFKTVLSFIIILAGIFAFCTLTQIHIQKMELLAEKRKLKEIINAAPDCIKIVSKDGCLLDMNPAGLRLIEAGSLQSLQGQCVYPLIAPEDRQRFIDFNQRVFAGYHEQIHYDIIGLHGTRRSMESRAVPIKDFDGNVSAHLAITRDVTQARKLTKRLSYQASHDMLTELLNRMEFESRLNETLSLAKTDQRQHALFILDIDQFKLINDTAGHIVGDSLLQHVAQIIRSQIRQGDEAGRLGGDEYAVLLKNCSIKKAYHIAESLRFAIEDFSLPWESGQFRITTSIGVTSIGSTDTSVSEVIKRADTSCYIAKSQGRNRVHVHEKNDHNVERYHNEASWVAKIHAGIESQQFEIFAQIIKNLTDPQEISHVELLIRYRSDDNKLAPPGAFLPAAERYGISSKIDRYVITHALSYLKQHPELLKYAETYCINLSGHSLSEKSFLEFVEDQFVDSQPLAHHICFEITETVAISNLKKAVGFIEALRKIGCRFALDDFGSGLSSFGYLKNLSVDYLKIDGAFVRSIENSPMDLAMVRSINEIGHALNKRTVAEFVENDNIKKILQDVGVDFVQGYGIARPVPLVKLIEEIECQS
ncbi:MAG: EAL domain-containing protein [Nitrosomonas sp.]|nr:EAL domain-containing protein [Nitrosomonas sp.]